MKYNYKSEAINILNYSFLSQRNIFGHRHIMMSKPHRLLQESLSYMTTSFATVKLLLYKRENLS